MRWWLCLWCCRSGFSALPNAAAEAATRRSRAHNSDKMAGRNGKGYKDRGGNDFSTKTSQQFPKVKCSAFAQAAMTVNWWESKG